MPARKKGGKLLPNWSWVLLPTVQQSQFTDTRWIWKIFSLWVCFEQLWDPFSLMNYILLSLSAIFSQTLRNWEFSPPDPFHCGSFNLHASSIPFPVRLGGHEVALWWEWRSQSRTDSGFSVQVYILGWLADFFFSTSFTICKKKKRLVAISYVSYIGHSLPWGCGRNSRREIIESS